MLNDFPMKPTFNKADLIGGDSPSRKKNFKVPKISTQSLLTAEVINMDIDTLGPMSSTKRIVY
jgi:hypothetical protein